MHVLKKAGNQFYTLKGFSLIELLTVIAIIGVMAAASIYLINPQKQFEKSRDAKRKADIQQIRAALELYRSDNGSYPPTTGWVYSNAGDSWIPGLSPTYMKTIPKDPKNSGADIYTGNVYGYYSTSVFCPGVLAGTTYILTVPLENASDTERGQTIQYGTCSWGFPALYTFTSP